MLTRPENIRSRRNTPRILLATATFATFIAFGESLPEAGSSNKKLNKVETAPPSPVHLKDALSTFASRIIAKKLIKNVALDHPEAEHVQLTDPVVPTPTTTTSTSTTTTTEASPPETTTTTTAVPPIITPGQSPNIVMDMAELTGPELAYVPELEADGVPSGLVDILSCIAWQESNDDPTIVNSEGYAGLYQFGQATWNSNGGVGTPESATAEAQTTIAVNTIDGHGLGPWTGDICLNKVVSS